MLEGEFWKGSDMIFSNRQFSVFHTLTVLSSDCRYEHASFPWNN